MDWMTNPMLQSSVFPLAISLIVMAAARLAGTDRIASLLTGLAVAGGFLSAYLMIRGMPAIPPVGSSQKIVYALLLSFLVGGSLEFVAFRPRLHIVAGGILSVILVGWIGWPLLKNGNGIVVFQIILIAIAATFAIRNFNQAAPTVINTPATIAPVIPLLFIAIGVGGIALLGSSASAAQTGFSLSAALGGYLLWNWPKFRIAPSPTLIFTTIGTLAALTAQVVLYTKAIDGSLLILGVVLFTSKFTRKISLTERLRHEKMKPVLTGLIAALITLIALAVAWLAAGASDPYSG